MSVNFCSNCGASVAPDRVACAYCGKGLCSKIEEQPAVPSACPESYMVHALILGGLSFLICLIAIPFAIASFYYADKVDGQWRRGDYEGATHSSINARKWFVRGVWVVGIVWVLFFLFFFLVIIFGSISLLGLFSSLGEVGASYV
ncbi:MAG: CD225/dispanin family protein [Porphyromonadaceae bacterium]|nr:CD225/dispanin family protein [Porphyromonadaceae bacterium]